MTTVPGFRARRALAKRYARESRDFARARVGYREWVAFLLLVGLTACSEGTPFSPSQPSASRRPTISSPVAPPGAATCGESLEVDLLARRDSRVGSVKVANDRENLYVTFVTRAGWTLERTYLEVTTSVDDLPLNPAGHPVPGHFSYHERHGQVTEYTYVVALSDLGVASGDPLIVLAEATVRSQAGHRTETAFGAGTRIGGHGSRASYFTYEVRDCVVFVGSTISAGANHSCALSTTGAAYCWGYGGHGQLGTGSFVTSFTPVAVRMPDGVSFTEIAAGAEYTVALSTTGTVYAWGWNLYGELGDGSTSVRPSPVAVTMLSGVRFSDISANPEGRSTLAVSTDGHVYAWGANESGQLGDGTTLNRATPIAVTMPGGVSFREVAAGTNFSLALSTTGTVYGWGYNRFGELGDGTTVDRPVPLAVTMPTGVSFRAVRAGGGFSIALSTAGDVYGWGSNIHGELGDGTTTNRLTPVAVVMPPGVRFTVIDAGWEHALALSTTGAAYAWGSNSFGQLGDGSITNRLVPVAVSMPPGVAFTAVSGGANHSLAVASSGNAFGWGYNGVGQVGDGTTSTPWRPTPLVMPPGVSF